MAKVALLVGVGEYAGGLTALPGTLIDIQEMQRVLQDPKVGGFDQVNLLPNPDVQTLQIRIERLFSENRSRDDLILLYFSGHGVKDDNGSLYFATSLTRKNEQGSILLGTAVPTNFVQNCMSSSRCKRQILILDCCFSGAFANGMKAKSAGEEAIDIKTQLGGEGRAILTSSTATQVSDAGEGSAISIYTRYLVQGLDTGAADRDNDGQISVDELHEYAREKVQEASPRMKPEIYAVKEGYKILLAKAPQGDPKLVYRKAFEDRAKEKQGKLSSIDRRALNFLQKNLGLSLEVVAQIEDEILQPYQAFQEKLREFELCVQEVLEDDPQISPATLEDLRYFVQVMQLQDEDAEAIAAKFGVTLNPNAAVPATPVSIGEPKPPITDPPVTEPTPGSKEDIDYSQLSDLVKAENWREANAETLRLLLIIADRKDKGWLDIHSIRNLPLDALRGINQLWMEASQGRFGFSAQIQLYRAICITSPVNTEESWYKFDYAVKWRSQDAQGRWINGQYFNSSAPNGHLPNWRQIIKPGWGVTDRAIAMLDRFSAFSIDLTSINSERYQTTVDQQLSEDDLSSEKDIDYSRLRDLLKVGDWKEADQETYRTMIRAVGKKEGDYFEPEELLNFPCTDLKTIDQLWMKYSNGKFGFTVQKKIYLECGGEPGTEFPGDKIWREFCDRVGWRINSRIISYEDVIFDASALQGNLPAKPLNTSQGIVLVKRGIMFSSLALRLENCDVR